MANSKRPSEAADKLKEVLDLLESSSYDVQSTTSEDYARGLLDAHLNIVARNKLLTKLLDNYINTSEKRNKENVILRRVLFGIFTFILILLTVAVVVVLCKVDFNQVTISLVLSLFSVGGTYVGSLFTIYEIMIKYLFPTDQEKDTISMIRTLIENDIKVEELASKLRDRADQE